MKNYRRIMISSITVAIFLIIVKILGFFEKIVLANYFGTSDEADAYLFAFSIPLSIVIVLDEIIGPVIIPFITDQIKKNRSENGLSVYKRLALIILAILIPVYILGIYRADWIVQHFAPGFSANKQIISIQLLKNLMITLMFLGTSHLLKIAYFGFKRFNFPIMAQSLQKIMIILGIIVLHHSLGIKGAVVGCIAGTFLQAIVSYLNRPTFNVHSQDALPNPIHTNEMGRIFKLMLPLLIGSLVSETVIFVDHFIASKLGTGAIASISYAKKIIDLPVLLVPFSMGIVLLPHLSNLSLENDKTQFADLFEKSFNFLLILFTLLTVLTIAFNESIVKILFERGKFNVLSTLMTAKVLTYFAFGLVAFAVEIPIMQSFFAVKDTVTPIWVGILCVALNIALTIKGAPIVGFVIIPIAYSIQKIIKVIFLLILLKERIHLNMIKMGTNVIKCGFAAIILSFLMIIMNAHFHPLEMKQLDSVLYITLCAFPLVIVYLALLKIMRISVWMPTLKKQLYNKWKF